MAEPATRGADRAFVLHGFRSPLRHRPNEHLTNSQKTFTMQVPSGPSADWEFNSSSMDHRIDDGLSEMPMSGSQKDSPSIDELEQSLSELKMQVKSLTSSLTPALRTDYKKIGGLESNWGNKNGDWPTQTNGAFHEENVGRQAEWFLRPRHLVQSLGRYPALESLGVPVHSVSPVDRVVGLTGSELSSKTFTPSTISPVDIAYKETLPVSVGAPHLIGVSALLPPQIPVRLQSPERTRSSSLQDQFRTLRRSRNIRSRSLSPASKRVHWQHSRPRSPKPVWRPNSTKVNACGRPPPPLKRQKAGSRKVTIAKPFRSYSYSLRSFNPSSQPDHRLDDGLSSWRAPRSFTALDVAAPSTQEISERFLQTLAEGDTRLSLVETSPYQQELSQLRLQRLRVEEELLLELKRQQELERLRGPQLKWYEMKGPRFHYEAHKNNETLQNIRGMQSGDGQGLFSASGDFSPKASMEAPSPWDVQQ
ncbi:uncharacterized protein LOC116990538 [Amblyraja radiata]|uniref:uncharacterized protein LOC116990538 n=1 Tax=Amblyraja radiata TaxID=386614 RepID=UPI00140313EC|nr:uncharacterized protein LOC116990538 [Amblyraja radiata]